MTIISEQNVIPVKPVNGLVAFGNCVINHSLYIGSIGIHKRRDGNGYRITYPTKRIGEQQINIYHPINNEAHEAIESALIEKCREVFEGGAAHDDRYGEARAGNL